MQKRSPVLVAAALLLACSLSMIKTAWAMNDDLKELLMQRYPKYIPRQMPEKILQAASYRPSEYGFVDHICFDPPVTMKEVNEYLNPNGSMVSECWRAVGKLLYDRLRREAYATRMLDSRGRRESGLYVGNHKWWGFYHECENSYSDDFKGKWCQVGVAGYWSPDFQYIQIGTCFPDVCDEEEINEIFGRRHLGNLSLLYTETHCPPDLSSYTAVDIVALVICGVLGIVIISASAYETTLLISNCRNVDPNTGINALSEENLSIPSKLILSFSITRNTKALLDTTQKEGNINVLHGMRFLSMTWVILGHAFNFSMYFVDNIVVLSEYYISHGEFQAVGNATFSVDTFFFLSGLLVAYLGLRELDKRGTLNVPLMYLNRYLRLTPCLAFVMLITVSLYSKFGNGPNWAETYETFRHPCALYWWANLLYINNLHPTNMADQCIGWVWYLANDMQFYLLSPIFLFLLYLKPMVGLGALALCIVGSATATGAISKVYDVAPDAIGMAILTRIVISELGGQSPSTDEYGYINSYMEATETTIGPTSAPEDDGYIWSDTYERPWCRLGAYLVGMTTGYILYVTRDGIKMKKWFVVLMWIAVAAVELSIIYGLVGPITSGDYPSTDVAAFYNAVSRPVWAAALAWVTIACVNGYGGPINVLLSWKYFIPLSRLTYCAYLVHPLVYYYLYSNAEQEPHFSVMNIVVYYLATLLLSYGLAYIVSMSVEAPMGGIQKGIFPRRKASSQKKAPVVISNGEANGDVEMQDGLPNGKSEGMNGWNTNSPDNGAAVDEKGDRL